MVESSSEIIAEIDNVAARLADARAMIERRVFGQGRVIEEVLAAMLSGGHALLVGVPGLGKTRLVETLSEVFGLNANRVQFTPDLMPADILGSEVLQTDEHGRRTFEFVEGPIFCQLLMADEINRASPRTQSALLQAMQEFRVSIAGSDRRLPRPFHVLATQNPIELEGTYPLPEAQLDRFVMKVDVGYPDRSSERTIAETTTSAGDAAIEYVLGPEDLVAAQAIVRQLPIGESIVEMIMSVVRTCRPEAPESTPRVRELVDWGPGPRATQALMLSVRSRALLQGRLSPSADDVAAMSRPVLSHRMTLNFAARSRGERVEGLVSEVVARIADTDVAA